MTSKESLNLFKQYHWRVEDKNKALEILEKLVERDTPLKITNPYIESPVHKGDKVLKESQCKCKRPINDDFSFCPYCGQRLDWSE